MKGYTKGYLWYGPYDNREDVANSTRYFMRLAKKLFNAAGDLECSQINIVTNMDRIIRRSNVNAISKE